MLTHFLREYNVNKILLSNVGLWPYQNRIVKTLLSVFCILLETSYIPFEILLFTDNPNDMNAKFESCYQFNIVFAFIIRILNHIWNHDKLRWLCEAMDNHWNIFSSDAEIQVLKYYSFVSRKFTMYYTMILYSFASVLIIYSITPQLLDIILPLNESRARVFVVDISCRIDSEEYYTSFYCYTLILIVIGVSVLVSFDTMYITCCIHAWTLFFIVGKQIEDIISNVSDHTQKIKKYSCMNVGLDLSSEEILYREYITCLKKYQLALKFVRILNSTYQFFQLISLLMIIICISAMAIRVTYVTNQFMELSKFLLLLITVFVHLLILCYSGQKILDESQNIFYHTYAMEWYNVSPRIKSLLLITLYRSNIPCKVTAGNTFTLSMTTYASVIRMSLSYFTTFLSLKN